MFNWPRRQPPFRELVSAALTRILQQQGQIMAQLDDLTAALNSAKAEITNMTSVEQSAVALLQQLKAMVDTIPTAPDLTTAISIAQDISTALTQNDASLAAAVAANTPAAPLAPPAPPAPAPAPEPVPTPAPAPADPASGAAAGESGTAAPAAPATPPAA